MKKVHASIIFFYDLINSFFFHVRLFSSSLVSAPIKLMKIFILYRGTSFFWCTEECVKLILKNWYVILKTYLDNKQLLIAIYSFRKKSYLKFFPDIHLGIQMRIHLKAPGMEPSRYSVRWIESQMYSHLDFRPVVVNDVSHFPRYK